MTERADLVAAEGSVAIARRVVDAAASRLVELGGVDENQTLAYDLAHAASAVSISGTALAYGARGELESRIACAFIADVVSDLAARTLGRESTWGVSRDWVDPARPFLESCADPGFVGSVAETPGPTHLDEDFALVAETFHRFAAEQIRPLAEH